MSLRIIWMSFCCLLFSSFVQAQQDSLKQHHLKAVQVHTLRGSHVAHRIQETSYQTFDSTVLKFYSHKTLNDFLQENSNAIIKNYGVSTLSTISIRGGSAAQTAVLWHGINVNGATTGITDFSTLPVSLFDEVGLSANQTNQIGGALILKNQNPTYRNDAELKLGISYESLRNKSLIFSQKSSGHRWQMQNKFFLTQANNRFTYINPIQDSVYTQTHAHADQFGFLSDGYKKIKSQQEIGLHLWYNRYYRQIPPTLYELNSQKIEHGNTFRSLFTWNTQTQTGKLKASVRLAYLREQYAYQDSLIQFYPSSAAQQIPFQIELQYAKTNRHLWTILATSHYASMLNQQESYVLRTGAHLSYKYSILKLGIHSTLSVQKEWSAQFDIPWAVGIMLNKTWKSNLQLYTHWHQSYRLPTLNELYFNPGGNPNLLPEKSRNAELGLQWEHHTKNLHWQLDGSAYYRKVNHWILWYGNSILTPHNIALVESYGTDSKLQCTWSLKKRKNFTIEGDQPQDLVLKSSILYAYTISTTTSSGLSNPYADGKQLPYVPRYQVKFSLGLATPRWELTYWRSYTGYRFTTTDESEYLLPYSLHNLRLSLQTNTKQYRIVWQANANNLLNQSYEGVWGRMMPGRNVALAVSFVPIRKNCCKRLD